MSHTPILNPYTPLSSEHISTKSCEKAQDSWAEKAGQCIVIPHLAEPTPVAPSVIPKRTSQLGARCVFLPAHADPTHSLGQGYSFGANPERGQHQLALTAPLHTWLGEKRCQIQDPGGHAVSTSPPFSPLPTLCTIPPPGLLLSITHLILAMLSPFVSNPQPHS